MMIWLACMTLFFANPTDGQSLMEQVDWDASGVARCINDYMTGTSKGNKAQIRRAFLSNAGLQIIRDGKHKRFPIEEYIAFFEEGKANDRVGRIVSADITGNAAMVKVEIHSGGRRFSDYLVLLKVDGSWKIAEKIAFSAPKDQL